MTLSELQAKREKLIASIADAVRSVQNGDQSVTNEDIKNRQISLNILDAEIAKATSGSAGSSSRIGTFALRDGL